MAKRNWLLLLTQLPASASTTRVALWRKLRAAGATSVEHGAWMLPVTNEHRELMKSLLVMVQSHDGSATLFEATALDGDDAMEARFSADRAREYQEFATRAQGLLDEVAKEIAASKFTYAELEEVEDDLQKLETWLKRITARDFYAGEDRESALGLIADCRGSIAAFSEQVFEAEGLN